ncbi:MAG: YlbF family regulator [Lachnospiraceae bacterium]|nr:YlbF family regulator [Lachnospiraceae bacterium]
MLSDKLIRSTIEVTSAIRETKEYEDFVKQQKIARSDPETRSLIERARNLQSRFMEIPENDRNSDYAESIQNEYEEITENSSVYDYLRAEAVYMTMIQEVLGNIIETVDIDI